MEQYDSPRVCRGDVIMHTLCSIKPLKDFNMRVLVLIRINYPFVNIQNLSIKPSTSANSSTAESSPSKILWLWPFVS